MTHSRYALPRQAAPKLILRLGGMRLAVTPSRRPSARLAQRPPLRGAATAAGPDGPDSATDVLSSGAVVSDEPALAYLRDHVVRLGGGTACPNYNRALRAIAIIDFDDVGVVLRCWNCHADILQVEER